MLKVMLRVQAHLQDPVAVVEIITKPVALRVLAIKLVFNNAVAII